MQKVWHAIQASVLYLIFALTVVVLISALRSGGKFHFRNGEELSKEQAIVAFFVHYFNGGHNWLWCV